MTSDTTPSTDAGSQRRPSAWRIVLPLATLGAVAAAWHFTDLSEVLAPDRIREVAAPIRGEPWAPLVAFACFAIAGSLMVPITAMIVANALLFEPAPALVAAVPGVLASASLGFFAGRTLWKESVDRLLAGRFGELNRALSGAGILPMAVLRLIPIAPFAVVNLAAGASEMRFRDYLGGTALSMIPGIALMTVTADGIARAARDPSGKSVAIAVGLVIVFVAFARFARRWAARRADRDEGSGDPSDEATAEASA